MSLPALATYPLKTPDGQRIVCSLQKTAAPEPHPTILWIHGGFEHRQRYHALMAQFAEWGYASLAFDLRGHGESSGPPAYINNFLEYSTDLQTVYNAFADRILGNLFLVGHSMGALVAIRLLQEEQGRQMPVAGAALSSPLLGLHEAPPAWKRLLSQTMVHVFPKMQIDNGLRAEQLTHDPAVIEAHRNDPLIRRKATPGWYEEMMRNQALAFKKADRIRVPLLVMTAGDDTVVSNSRTRQWCKRVDQRVSLQTEQFPGFRHELFNETERQKPIQVLRDWLATF